MACTPEFFAEHWRNLTLKTKANWPTRREPSIALGTDERIPIPALINRQRIQGPDALNDLDGKGFSPSGRFDLRCVLNVMDVCAPLQLDKSSHVLDWGVGCGRMARHIPHHLRAGLIGIDVDPINIRWCQENIPFGNFHCINPFKPTSLPDNYFDLIYSHSVMTHLKPEDQAFWLKELARISRGSMILSIHGMYAAGIVSWSQNPEVLLDWMEKGFIGGHNQNPDVADVTPAGYYTSAHMTAKYIYEVWSEFVDVNDIVIGGFGHTHDAVVCTPKA